MLQLLHTDVIDAHDRAGALLLTLDGRARGLRGNIAHAFIRRWPDDYEDFESQLRFPIPLGSAVRTDAETDSPWATILFVATLHHFETLDEAGKLDVIRRGLRSALDLAARSGITSVATPVLKGGWRLTLAEAYGVMLTTHDASAFARLGGTLMVCCNDGDEYQALTEGHRQMRCV